MALRLFSKLRANNLIFRPMTTTNFNLDKVQEELEKNPYFDKYAEKIAVYKKKNPVEYNSKMKEMADKKVPKKRKSEERDTPPEGFTKASKLSDLMKLELLVNKSGEEVSKIWHEFHQRLECISNVISGDVYKHMLYNSKSYPTFILPVPRSKGYEFMMVFFSDNKAHFTPLLKFQEVGADAPECLSIQYYVDLMDSKNIVLMRGKYDKDIVSNLEANCLSSSLQLYYGDPSGKRTRLLDCFTNDPDNFKHMDLITDFESYSKSAIPTL